jgi:hypothetical protein
MLNNGQTPTVELDSGSQGLFLESSYTQGLPPVSGACPSGPCQQPYSGGVTLYYDVVQAQVTIEGSGSAVGKVTTGTI